MTGFIRGLFGGKAQNPGESDRPLYGLKKKSSPETRGSATRGSLLPGSRRCQNLWRHSTTCRTVKNSCVRTFAKKRGETEEKESISPQISAMDSLRMQENGQPESKPAATETTFQPTFKQESPSFDRL